MDHLNIKHAGLLPWRLVASTSGLMAGCTDQQKLPLTTLGQLPAFTNINAQLEALNLKPPKPESNIDTKHFVDCMAPLTSRLQPGAVKALGEFKAEFDPLQDLNAGNLLDKQSLIVDLLDELTTSPLLAQDLAEQTELRQQVAPLLKLKTDDPRVVLDVVSKQLARLTGKLAPKSSNRRSPCLATITGSPPAIWVWP